MRRFVFGRVLSLVPVLLGVSLVTFALGALAPGDPAELILERLQGHPPTGEQIAALREELGLERPLVVQYLDWLGRAVRGDLGQSWVSRAEVTTEIRERLPNTVLLAGTALVLSWSIAVPLGVVAAYRRNTVVDHVCRLGALLGAATPSYFLAYLLLLVFAVKLRVTPTSGFGTPVHLFLPALTLALGTSASLTRLTRAAVLETLGEDHVRTAWAKGTSEDRVLFHHVLRNAMIPIITVLGLSLGGLLNGAFIVEWIFAWPGLGGLAIDAISSKDYPLIQAFVLFAAMVYVAVNFLTDIAYGWLDPRIRAWGARR